MMSAVLTIIWLICDGYFIYYVLTLLGSANYSALIAVLVLFGGRVCNAVGQVLREE